MAVEIRHKGPVLGQTVLYTNGAGVQMPAIVTSISASTGTIGVATFPDQLAPGNATAIPYDGRGVNKPSWMWSDDL